MKKFAIIGVTCLSLSACTSSTKESLKSSSSTNKVEINSPHNYQQTYRILSERMKTCNRAYVNDVLSDAMGLGINLEVTSNLDSEKQIGTIEYYSNTFMGKAYAAVIEIVPTGSDTSKVVINKQESLFNKNSIPNAIESWTKSPEDTTCYI